MAFPNSALDFIKKAPDSGSAQRGRPRCFDPDQALQIAMKLFWEKGYIQTTMMDICNAIGIKAPSFYHAFGSKEKLFLKTLAYYEELYWNEVTVKYMAASDIYEGVKCLMDAAVWIYMQPNMPKGCFIDISTVGLPKSELRIHAALEEIQERLKVNIRMLLLRAIDAGQLPHDCDVPVITGALCAYLKGLSVLARGNMCQAELKSIAGLALSLLPARRQCE